MRRYVRTAKSKYFAHFSEKKKKSAKIFTTKNTSVKGIAHSLFLLKFQAILYWILCIDKLSPAFYVAMKLRQLVDFHPQTRTHTLTHTHEKGMEKLLCSIMKIYSS